MAQPKSDDFHSWVVAVAGNSIYIGQRQEKPDLPELTKRGFIRLCPAYQVQVTVIPLKDQQGNLHLQREITAMPFLVTLKDEPLLVNPDAIQFIDELKPEDRNRYKNLVQQASDRMTQLSAQEAGLTTARTMPGGNA